MNFSACAAGTGTARAGASSMPVSIHAHAMVVLADKLFRLGAPAERRSGVRLSIVRPPIRLALNSAESADVNIMFLNKFLSEVPSRIIEWQKRTVCSLTTPARGGQRCARPAP